MVSIAQAEETAREALERLVRCGAIPDGEEQGRAYAKAILMHVRDSVLICLNGEADS
jgi:hypothetical protein